MPEIKIQYGDVFSQCGSLRSQIATERAVADDYANQIRSALEGQLDSATNAAHIALTEQNRLKVHSQADILDKLAEAVINAAERVQVSEQRVSSVTIWGGR